MTTGIFAISREYTFLWTAIAAASGGGGEDLTVFKVGFKRCTFQEGRHLHPMHPAGYGMERYQLGVQWFRAMLGGIFDKSAAAGSATNLPSPGGTGLPPTQPGTLVITITTTGGSGGNVTHSKTVTGFLHTLSGSMQDGAVGGAPEYEYAFVGSATQATDTITTA